MGQFKKFLNEARNENSVIIYTMSPQVMEVNSPDSSPTSDEQIMIEFTFWGELFLLTLSGLSDWMLPCDVID